jgi:hypothetical protein
MSSATLIMQQKLYALGVPTPVSGLIHKTNFSDASRVAVQRFKSAHGLSNDGYINADFLKKLDEVFYKSNVNSTLPKSYYKGWNLDIGFTDITQYNETPDSPSMMNNSKIPDINDRGNMIISDDIKNNSPVKLGVIAAGIVGLIYIINSGKKKKRK